MRPFLLTLLLTASCSLAASTPAAPLQARSSAVSILERDEDGQYHAICSGANVALERGVRILSAGHCVAENPKGKYQALDSQGRRWDLSLESWELSWPRSDFATFKSRATKALPALNVAKSPLEIGDEVFSWSGPLGMGLMFFKGYYNGIVTFPTEDAPDVEGFPMCTINGDGGASGSSVLNSSGEVVGIWVGGWKTTVKLQGALLSPVPK